MPDLHISRDNVGKLCYVMYVCFNLGFYRPSPIQQRAITPMINGRDVIMQGKSKSGKSIAFLIAMLQSIDLDLKDTQVLCLSPTKELAEQIQRVNMYL